ncbi:MAG: RHS repeat-associated core domain-containing protein [Flavisolibacter sp.]|nr:RHS repeat-associated core domain-containing protein [Flavisolibacter sp.]
MLAVISDKKIGVASQSNSSLIDHYEAEVVSAQDYYPFGMLQPGRHGYSVPGGWATSGTGGVPQSLRLHSRTGNTPLEYKATETIEFVPEFESGEGDEFTAFITTENSGGNASGVYGTDGLYRYGFNGKENDNEVKGEGNQQDYGMRIYDPRVSRFLSVDPIAPSFPWNSPYAYAEGDPINYIDLDGLEKPNETAQASIGAATRTTQKVVTEQTVKNGTKLVVDQTGKLIAQEGAKKAGEHWILRGIKWLGSKSFGLTLGAVLSDGELASGELAPEIKARIRSYSKPAPAPQPLLMDPRTITPPDKGGEDGAHLYKTLDNQKNTGKGGLGYVANNMNNPLPYVGITTDKVIGGRYSATSLRVANSEIIGTDKFTTVAGAETAIIALNTYGVNYKLHLANLHNQDVRASTRIANLKFTYKNPVWIAAGIRWLNQIRPGWDQPDNPNSLLFQENKKGANHPTH